ncbi:hypothetical protein Tco_1082812 [Tanacetum coccineum]|uniref:Uncharacterized protein n=1 Tax=Tanacetum coccineum TaxID=301880 RepID=A0ABQ5I3M9_9ASTR
MTLDIHNWPSFAHQELLKIVKDEIYPIVNQVNARVQNFKIQFLKEAAKFVRDFKSLANEADESLAKHKDLKFEIERLLFLDKRTSPKVIPKDNPSKTSRVDNVMPNETVKASVRTKPITTSQPHVISQENVNSNLNGISSTGVESTAKTRRPQPRRNIKNDRVPSASKSSCVKNKDAEVEEHYMNLLLSNNKKHMSFECNNIKLAIRNDKSKVVCAICKQYLITANHDVCVLNYVNGMNSRDSNQSANVSNVANQKKHKPKVRKPKKLGSKERLASPKPSKPRICIRWSPTRRIFDLKGKIIASSEYECQSDCSIGDNACTSNPQEPTSKRFPNSTFSLPGRLNMFMVCRLGMLKAYDRKFEAPHKFHLEISRNRPL